VREGGASQGRWRASRFSRSSMLCTPHPAVAPAVKAAKREPPGFRLGLLGGSEPLETPIRLHNS
jgi:hypothetical protein